MFSPICPSHLPWRSIRSFGPRLCLPTWPVAPDLPSSSASSAAAAASPSDHPSGGSGFWRERYLIASSTAPFPSTVVTRELLPGSSSRVTTVEGKGAVDEAIKYLSRQKPLPPLGWSDGLAAAAAELAEEEGRSGATGHVGRQSRGPKERIERHG